MFEKIQSLSCLIFEEMKKLLNELFIWLMFDKGSNDSKIRGIAFFFLLKIGFDAIPLRLRIGKKGRVDTLP